MRSAFCQVLEKSKLDMGRAATAASIDGIANGAAEDAAVQAAVASSLADAELVADQHSGGEMPLLVCQLAHCGADMLTEAATEIGICMLLILQPPSHAVFFVEHTIKSLRTALCSQLGVANVRQSIMTCATSPALGHLLYSAAAGVGHRPRMALKSAPCRVQTRLA